MESKEQQTEETTSNTLSQNLQPKLVFEVGLDEYAVIMNSLAEMPAKLVYRTMILMEGQFNRQTKK